MAGCLDAHANRHAAAMGACLPPHRVQCVLLPGLPQPLRYGPPPPPQTAACASAHTRAPALRSTGAPACTGRWHTSSWDSPSSSCAQLFSRTMPCPRVLRSCAGRHVSRRLGRAGKRVQGLTWPRVAPLSQASDQFYSDAGVTGTRRRTDCSRRGAGPSPHHPLRTHAGSFWVDPNNGKWFGVLPSVPWKRGGFIDNVFNLLWTVVTLFATILIWIGVCAMASDHIFPSSWTASARARPASPASAPAQRPTRTRSLRWRGGGWRTRPRASR